MLLLVKHDAITRTPATYSFNYEVLGSHRRDCPDPTPSLDTLTKGRYMILERWEGLGSCEVLKQTTFARFLPFF